MERRDVPLRVSEEVKFVKISKEMSAGSSILLETALLKNILSSFFNRPDGHIIESLEEFVCCESISWASGSPNGGWNSFR